MTTPTGLWNNPQWNQTAFGGGAGAPAGTTRVDRGLLYPALRKAGITLGPQRTPSPAQYQDAIEELNRLVGSLSCDRLFIYSIANYQLPILESKTSYTIGQLQDSGIVADFDAPRPQGIESANVISGGVPYPLAVVTDLQWALYSTRSMPNTTPSVLYNDRAVPFSNLYFYGQPMAGMTLDLFSWLLVPEVQSISDAIFLPPGYEDALVLNLACRLAPHFQREVHPDVRQQARESLMRLESINAPRPIADTSGALSCGCGGYNVLTDEC